MATTLMTKLEAVNTMLERIWESPVSSLDTPGVSSVAAAKRILDQTIRNVLAKGWDFNTEEDITLTPAAVTGYINVPADALEIDSMPIEYMDVVQRGTRLYDKRDHTFAFTRAIKVRTITLLEFTDLPQSARTYIALAAARVFKDSWEHADTPTTPNAEEAMALYNLEEHEASTGDHNILGGSWSVANILERF